MPVVQFAKPVEEEQKTTLKQVDVLDVESGEFEEDMRFGPEWNVPHQSVFMFNLKLRVDSGIEEPFEVNIRARHIFELFWILENDRPINELDLTLYIEENQNDISDSIIEIMEKKNMECLPHFKNRWANQ